MPVISLARAQKIPHKLILIVILVFSNTAVFCQIAKSSSLNGFSEIISKNLPAIVSVTVYKTEPVADDDLTTGFGPASQSKSTASGVIYSGTGYIITNSHVVKNAVSVDVLLNDSRSFEATLVGSDELTEIAVLKITAGNLSTAEFGQSSNSKIGDWVIAIGTPFYLRSTVTAGIISFINREVDIISSNFAIESYIQTDAAINPGNSGGALINENGQVIGIIAAIATASGWSEGYGFAIPSEIVLNVANDLIQYGRVMRLYFGAAVLNLNDQIRRAYNIHYSGGIFIDDVFEDSPAFRAGLSPADILLTFDEDTIYSIIDLQKRLSNSELNEIIRLQVISNDAISTKKMKLDEYSSIEPSNGISRKTEGLGLKVRLLAQQDSHLLEYHENGILVEYLDQFGAAAKSGLKIDDIIVNINGIKIIELTDYSKSLRAAKNEVHVFRVRRGKQTHHFFVQGHY